MLPSNHSRVWETTLSSSPFQSLPAWWQVAPEHGVNLSWEDEQMRIRDFSPVHLGEPVGLIIDTRLGEGSPTGA